MRCGQHRRVAGTEHRSIPVRNLPAVEQHTAGCSTLIRDGLHKGRRVVACEGPGNSFVSARTSCLLEGVAGRTVPGRPSDAHA